MTTGERHIWIGVEFHLRKDGTAIVEIPGQYLRDLSLLLKPLEIGTGSIPLSEALCTVGKVGRVSQVINEARPFTGALYAAYTAAVLSDKEGPRQAPIHHAPCSRFATVATWLRLLISGNGDDIFPLIQDVYRLPRRKGST